MALATKVGGFDVLCSNIELDNIDEMEKSAKSIAKKLNSVYYASEDDDTSHLYIVGSVGRKTAIKGSSDLDILFDLPTAPNIQLNQKPEASISPIFIEKSILVICQELFEEDFDMFFRKKGNFNRPSVYFTYNRMSVRLNIIFGGQLFAGVQLVFDQQSKNESC